MKRLPIALASALVVVSLLLSGSAAAAVFVGEVDSGYQSSSDGYLNFSDAGIYLVRTHTVAKFLATGTRPRLSPNRRTVAYCEGAGLMVQPLGGGSARQIGGGLAYDDRDLNCGIAFEWAPGGRALVTTEPPTTANCFQTGMVGARSWPQISLAALDGTRRVLVPVGDNPVLRAGVLAYVAPVPCTGVGAQAEGAFVAAPDGSKPRELTIAPEVPYATMKLALRPDGRRLAVVDGGGTITLVSTVGKPKAVRLGRGSEPAWSPNGRWLAYSDRRGRLVVVDAASRRVIHRIRGPVGRIVWSADGRRILFTRADPGAGVEPEFRYDSAYTVTTRTWSVHRVARAGFLKTFVGDSDGSWVDVDWR